MTMEQLQPVMEAPPPTTDVDEAKLVAEVQDFETRLEALKEFASTELGRQALTQAGMPEILLSEEEMGNPPITFIEQGIARIALGGF